MIYHISAFFFGFILDMIFGDPHGFPHPVRLMGGLISALEKRLLDMENRNLDRELKNGKLLAAAVLLSVSAVSSVVFIAAYFAHPIFGACAEAFMTYQILAAKGLKSESMKVFDRLERDDLSGARKEVSMIVGRDADNLDAEGVTKAAVETVAENTSDGVVAPMLYCAVGGPVLGIMYKAVNTMDSMIGYKNDKYLYFGRAAAKLDDAANFLPARISAVFMLFSAFIGGFDFKNALRIYKRDRLKHSSPNSAHTEAVCAGALGVRLAGDAVYFGKTVKKPFIGEALRKIEPGDIRRANRLMYFTAWTAETVCILVMLATWLIGG